MYFFMSKLTINKIKNSIIKIRDEEVILDSCVADFYGTTTRDINKAVKNNPDKFPKGYVFNLNKIEWENLKCNFSTSNKTKQGGKNKLPKVFTEKGLYMLATILKSKKATETTLTIIETFSKIRELKSNMEKLQSETEKKNQKELTKKSGEIISEILGSDLENKEYETTIELNLAVLKFKHKIKKEK